LLFFWAGGSWRVGRGGMEDIAAVIASWCAMSHRVGSFVAAWSDGRNIDTKRRQRKRKNLEEEEEKEKQLAELMDWVTGGIDKASHVLCLSDVVEQAEKGFGLH
jgi:uncharacterized protein YegL